MILKNVKRGEFIYARSLVVRKLTFCLFVFLFFCYLKKKLILRLYKTYRSEEQFRRQYPNHGYELGIYRKHRSKVDVQINPPPSTDLFKEVIFLINCGKTFLVKTFKMIN